MTMSARKFSTGVALITAAGLALTGCATDAAAGGDSDAASNTVTLIVHDSFPNDEFAAAASAATGYEVEVVSAGDGGELTSQLVLSADAPLADAFFGVDNVFASRIADAGVSEPYLPADLPDRATEYLYDEQGSLVPVDLGQTCINIDPAWFTENGLAEPSTYEDLVDPAYRGLTVLLDPSTSSTGASFLVGTIAKFGEDGFADYWKQLAENDVRIEQGWTEAYNGQFTQGGGDGTFPIVLSYSSSPAWTVTEDGTESTTVSLDATCSSQIEYAGVLKGAANPDGAKAVIDYMLSSEFQDTIADSMYVYPIDADAYVPEEWAKFAPLAESPNDLTPAEIGAGREGWLKTWSDATGW